MPLDDLRTAMRMAIATVTAIGVVTDFEPFAMRDEQFQKYFLNRTIGHVRGVTITRETTQAVNSSQRSDLETHGMLVRLYDAMRDDAASEKEFQDVVERIRDAMRNARRTLYGLPLFKVLPPQVRTIQLRLFGDVYIHYAEITQDCLEQVVS